MAVEIAIFIGAGTATIGWVYTARRARTLSRKQHTFNALLQMSMTKEFEDKTAKIRPYVRDNAVPANDHNLNDDVMWLLNYYEFLAAGIRNGDIDEQLLYDSEYGFILAFYEASTDYREGIRKKRQLQDIYAHLDWLYSQWKSNRPNSLQQFVEFVWGRPLHDWPPKLTTFG